MKRCNCIVKRDGTRYYQIESGYWYFTNSKYFYETLEKAILGYDSNEGETKND